MLFINYKLHIISYDFSHILLHNVRNLNLASHLGCCNMKHKCGHSSCCAFFKALQQSPITSTVYEFLRLRLGGKKSPGIAQCFFVTHYQLPNVPIS